MKLLLTTTGLIFVSAILGQTKGQNEISNVNTETESIDRSKTYDILNNKDSLDRSILPVGTLMRTDIYLEKVEEKKKVKQVVETEK